MNTLTSFDQLYNAHAGAVFRVCLRAVSRREVAEELTSEVFLTLHEQWNQLTPEQLPSWLFTVAKRRAADYWRRHYVEESWLATQVENTNWTEPEYPFADLLARCEALKPIHRICLTLRFNQGMSRAEIAQFTSLTELQVKSNLQYALQLLRNQMIAGTPLPTAKGAGPYGRSEA